LNPSSAAWAPRNGVGFYLVSSDAGVQPPVLCCSRRWARKRSHVLMRLAAATFLVACEPDVELLKPEGPLGSDATTIQTIVADSDLAERMGCSVGAGVPETSVYVRRDQVLDGESFVTDEAGKIELADTPAGRYWISAEKVIQSAPQGESGVPPPILAGGLLHNFRRGEIKSIELRGHERGSLVISEFYYHDPPWEVVNYDPYYEFQLYIELFNNADTTIYLDGKIVGGGFTVGIEVPSWPCSETRVYNRDPRGIWAQSFQRFPGTGTEYPLAPGAVVVIAEQAIDHSAIYPGLPDLRDADFQWHWEGRAENPEVPTMLPVQLRTNPTGRMMGLAFHTPFIADAVDLASLERAHNIQLEFALFPRESILDVASLAREYYKENEAVTLCGYLVDPTLDALPAFILPNPVARPDAHLLAVQRKLLADGRGLQRTGVSAVDFELGPRSPGRLR